MVHYGFLGVQDAPKAPKMPPNSSKNQQKCFFTYLKGWELYLYHVVPFINHYCKNKYLGALWCFRGV